MGLAVNLRESKLWTLGSHAIVQYTDILSVAPTLLEFGEMYDPPGVSSKRYDVGVNIL